MKRLENLQLKKQAEKINNVTFSDFLPKLVKTLFYSVGPHGINGIIYQCEKGQHHAVTERSENIFFLTL